MWRAQSDDKFVLTGKFKDLVITVLSDVFDEFFMRCRESGQFLKDIFDEVEEDPEDVFIMEWHQPFESLSTREKIMSFARVLKALIEPDEPAPELTQHTESAVFAIFELIRARIDEEIDFAAATREEGGDPYELRRLVSIVEKENIIYEDEHPPYVDYTSTDRDQWSEIVDSLEELILWDLDFLEDGAGQTIADAPPEVAAITKTILGIADDYYTQTGGPVSLDQFLDAVDYLLTTFTEGQ